MTEHPVWQPPVDARQATAMGQFWQHCETVSALPLPDYRALHQWSVAEPAQFWRQLWTFCDIIGDAGERTFVAGDRFETGCWFPDARLNHAENLLHGDDAAVAIIEYSEAGQRRAFTRADIRQQAGLFARALLNAGIKAGDRVAAYLPNRAETMIAALGCSWIGATWSSCSPDFGVEGVCDRFGQIEPALLLVTDSYQYNGKSHDLHDKNLAIADRLKPAHCVWIGDRTLPGEGHHHWHAFLAHGEAPPAFAQLPFNHPLFVLYSSGTTGQPKCIVHGAGGTLLQHAKEHRLHCDLGSGDKLFYFTTCGWMMWNWLLGALQSRATIVLYDGNPAWPDAGRLFQLAHDERLSHFGTSAKFIQSVEKAGCCPNARWPLDHLRMLLSTGSPLLHEGYDFIREHVGEHIQICSISGGTDIVSCFALGNPCLPVYRGELQCAGLGMDVRVVDENGEDRDAGKGELTCATPFPAMPTGFWADTDGARYHAAYFEHFPGRWAHGDYAEPVPHAGHDGIIIHGRADATLNPGGVRIGTAEIYRQVETLPAVRESVVIGQDWDGDTRVVLFVVLQDDSDLNDDLRQQIRQAIRQGASPRHVPAVIVQVPEIPRTVSGKIVELAIRDTVHGRPVRNRNALANPEALAHFRDIPELGRAD